MAFNSEFHRQDFLAALRFLEAQPNNWLLAEGIDAVEAKSSVLPVGVELDWLEAIPECRSTDGPRTLLWNHRWEFDKAPELFVRALRHAKSQGWPFRLIIAGEPGDNPSDAILNLPNEFPKELVHFRLRGVQGGVRPASQRADIAVSSTRHEFFGIGMIEAMAAGCVPLAPRRYNYYPSLIPAEHHADLLWEDEAGLFERLGALLNGPLPACQPFVDAARRYSWATVAPAWDHYIDRLSRDEFATEWRATPH